MEEAFVSFASLAALLVEAAAVLIVTYGAVEALAGLVGVVVKRHATHGERKAVWRRLGVWLLLGLEFALAADIIRTTISPTWHDIGELAAIAVVRTFLNHFLEKDFEAAKAAGSQPRIEPSGDRGRPVAAPAGSVAAP